MEIWCKAVFKIIGVQNNNIINFQIRSAAEAFSDKGLIVVKNPRADENEPPKNFSFDAVFGSDAEQKNIYDICASSVVESVLNGYNGTIFAYGQVILSVSCNIF